MSIPLPRAEEPIAESGRLARRWFDFMDRLTRAVNGPFPMRPYALSELPQNPADGFHCFVTNAAGGAVPVYSRGGVWRRFDDNSEVS